MVPLQRSRRSPQQIVQPSDVDFRDLRGVSTKRDTQKSDTIDLETRRTALGEKCSASQMLECISERSTEPVPGWVTSQRVTCRSDLLIGLTVSSKRSMFVQPYMVALNQITAQRRYMRRKLPVGVLLNHKGRVQIVQLHLQEPRCPANFPELHRVIVPARHLLQSC